MLLIILAVFTGLCMINAWRTIATLVFMIYTTLVLVLGFGLGAFWTMVLLPEQFRSWHISKGWVTMIVDNPDSSMMQIMSVPFVFVADIYRWILQITLFQGNIILVGFMLLALWAIVRTGVTAYRRFREGRKEMIDLRMSLARHSNPSPNVPPLRAAMVAPGYDRFGNFIGFSDRFDATKAGFFN